MFLSRYIVISTHQIIYISTVNLKRITFKLGKLNLKLNCIKRDSNERRKNDNSYAKRNYNCLRQIREIIQRRMLKLLLPLLHTFYVCMWMCKLRKVEIIIKSWEKWDWNVLILKAEAKRVWKRCWWWWVWFSI
jgi:hypothetical protein